MTDLLLMAENSLALVHVEDTSFICSVELGIQKDTTCPITISYEVTIWPEKVGELLASMYFFGTLNYLNNLRNTANTPANILWTTYGLLAIRDTGCLVLKMTLDETRCCVQLMHGVFTLELAIEYVVSSIKAAQ